MCSGPAPASARIASTLRSACLRLRHEVVGLELLPAVPADLAADEDQSCRARRCRSHSLGGAQSAGCRIFMVVLSTVLQAEALQLSGLGARQAGEEFDRARIFVRRDASA